MLADGSGLWLVALAWQVIELDGGPAQLSVVTTAYSIGLVGFVLVGGRPAPGGHLRLRPARGGRRARARRRPGHLLRPQQPPRERRRRRVPGNVFATIDDLDSLASAGNDVWRHGFAGDRLTFRRVDGL